jgi:hypothetical protein
MKRLFAALFLALVGALVGASGVASADPPNDFTSGGGRIERPEVGTIVEQFAFRASDEDDSDLTTAARGHFEFRRTGTSQIVTSNFDFTGSVDCLRVSGNRAAFSGPVEHSSSSPVIEGQHARFTVVDNDSMGGMGEPDEFVWEGFSPGPTSCPIGIDTNPITSGNILVSDAQ